MTDQMDDNSERTRAPQMEAHNAEITGQPLGALGAGGGTMAPYQKLDKKFIGDIRKVKDGSPVDPAEWVCFLAKDTIFATVALPEYRRGCVDAGCDEEQILAVDMLIANVAAWRAKYPERCKLPDAKGETLLP